MSKVILKVENLWKEYEDGRIKALRNLNLEMKEGEFVAMMGPSGCGKTTFLNIVGVLDRPTSGRVIIDGEDVNDINDLDSFRLKKIGFIFQAFYLLPTLTAIENVQIPMIESGISRTERVRKAEKLLEMVGLAERMNQLPAQLSGGERQRVAIARSLANNPRLLLADEPTGNLDSKSSEQIVNLLREINLRRRMTVVLVTHDPLVAEHADRILYMMDGQIVKEKLLKRETAFCH